MPARRLIYLDNNATTRTRPEVIEAMLPVFAEDYGNASSVHDSGAAAAYYVEKARERVAAALHCLPSEIYFTSGGTESNNIALCGLARILPAGRRHVITTAIEHHAVLWPLEELARDGAIRLDVIPADASGRVDATAVAAAMSHDTGLVSVMYANNETGVLQPCREIAVVAKERGAWFHCDAVQAVGKVPVDLRELPADTLSLSAHKFYGPKGVGALFVRTGVPLPPLMHGGGQERKLRPGTYNTPGIHGLGVALELAVRDMEASAAHCRAMRDRLCARLQAGLPDATVNGDLHSALPNTLNIALPGAQASEMVRLLSDRGVAASAGSACSSGNGPSASHVLVGMGLGLLRPMHSLRLSVCCDTTEAEIDAAADAIIAAATHLRDSF